MYLGKRIWATVVGWLHLSSVSQDGAEQNPIGSLTHHHTAVDVPDVQTSGKGEKPPPVRFKPPGAINPNFKCEYPEMNAFGWKSCSSPNDRECWLRNSWSGEEYTIHTNYEKEPPVGVYRDYVLNVTDGTINADGQMFYDAKLFNNVFPGPLIEGCWGDTFRIKVINNMQHNGTSIHWHGLRQFGTMEMDGVNGITQCPIAGRSFDTTKRKPDGGVLDGDYFVYEFTARQYGTSWYHSHYSVQYADGLQGPITIHGPTSANWDEAKEPLLMTDWSHITSFDILSGNNAAPNKTILLNGRGNVYKFGYEPAVPLEPQPTYELNFQAKDVTRPGRGKRYLLRLINTSFDTTFIVSIDNHWMQVISADFVPIEPYYNTSVLIGIGQRYTVIVEANPEGGWTNPLPPDGNFWIRTWVAENCGKMDGGRLGYERTGILRYNPLSETEPRTQPWNNIALACSDETYTSLVPKVPWRVGYPTHALVSGAKPDQFALEFWNQRKVDGFPLARFSFDPTLTGGFVPLQINYSDPSILHLWQPSANWSKSWVAVDHDGTDDSWVWLALTGGKSKAGTYGAHPIHLHGHDFAILEQAENKKFDVDNLNLQLDNPPRRDVVLLPRGGYVVIAFKLDNPGLWLMHCHIAAHASEGLGIQINERQSRANELWPFHNSSVITEANRTCENWLTWVDDCKNHWPGLKNGRYVGCDRAKKHKPYKLPTGEEVWPFQDDSGI